MCFCLGAQEVRGQNRTGFWYPIATLVIMQVVRAFAAICLGFVASLSLQGCETGSTEPLLPVVTMTTTGTGETVTATTTMTMTMTSTSTVVAWSERGDAGGIWGGFATLQPLSLCVFCLEINLQFSRQKVVRARLPKVDRWMLEWSIWRPFSYIIYNIRVLDQTNSSVQR